MFPSGKTGQPYQKIPTLENSLINLIDYRLIQVAGFVFAPQSRAMTGTDETPGHERIAPLCSILVVEDDHALGLLFTRWLEERGFRTSVVTTAAEAIEAAQSITWVDPLITDVRLPDGNGQTLADRIQRHSPHVRVLLISGNSHDELIDRGIVREASRFLHKPFSRAAFEQAVHAALAEKGTKQADG